MNEIIKLITDVFTQVGDYNSVCNRLGSDHKWEESALLVTFSSQQLLACSCQTSVFPAENNRRGILRELCPAHFQANLASEEYNFGPHANLHEGRVSFASKELLTKTKKEKGRKKQPQNNRQQNLCLYSRSLFEDKTKLPNVIGDPRPFQPLSLDTRSSEAVNQVNQM